MATLPPYLRELQSEIGGYADEYGLERFTQVYEQIDYQQMCEIAAYEGFPVRYPHWRFGMEYDRLMKSQTYGLSKIYELVINTDPCYAYLLEGNSLTDQKLVMSHVAGHNDFFRNNRFFAHTDRRMIDGMANHAARVRRWMDRHGVSEVEQFIDVCHSLDNLIDPWVPYRESLPARREPPPPSASGREVAETARGAGVPEEVEETDSVGKLRSSQSYMEDYINPPEFLEEQKKRAEREAEAALKIPPRPERDVLGFLMRHAPLADWEQDVLSIIRDEAYYFLPQRQTKIMNEGWATYWHSKIMTSRAVRDSEIIDYAQAAAGVTAMGPTQLNPYKLGVELFRHIEWRWDTGRFGPEWADVQRADEHENWDKQLGLGRQKIFDVRKLYNDVTFVDEFFTEEFCRRERFFTFSQNRRTGKYEIESKQFEDIKRKLVSQLTNFGQPFIYVVDSNDKNRGELLLGHRHGGDGGGGDLNLQYARETLRAVERIWRRPVSLLSVIDGKPKRFRIEDGAISVSEEPEAFHV